MCEGEGRGGEGRGVSVGCMYVRERGREGSKLNLSSVLFLRDLHLTKAVDNSLCL